MTWLLHWENDCSNRWVKVERGQLWSNQNLSWTQLRFLTTTVCSRLKFFQKFWSRARECTFCPTSNHVTWPSCTGGRLFCILELKQTIKCEATYTSAWAFIAVTFTGVMSTSGSWLLKFISELPTACCLGSCLYTSMLPSPYTVTNCKQDTKPFVCPEKPLRC